MKFVIGILVFNWILLVLAWVVERNAVTPCSTCRYHGIIGGDETCTNLHMTLEEFDEYFCRTRAGCPHYKEEIK